ncbi:S-adenosylmethionine uptake transporter [Altererythrobacter xiamenensis]|uniref:S-adenosylmethionine uptake transporter n=1 Tax=Altererythrobacter xiamenensis TaxID=1316679 RepID=A0A1Y6F465_9SPHN|nr:DMT family transporter [Altererythrobacter xiamenensis]SMQ69557.1 S-adenosylmethionine uptake transporter [Altererythrobacter xiamenensis]
MQDNPIKPVLATIAGIALFSAMDAVMKSAALSIGAYSAYFLRCLVGFVMIAPFWWYRARTFPSARVMRIHLLRGVVVAFMGWTFFFALTRLPLAEAIALSFIAPVFALYLAAVLLGETIERKAIIAAILGLAGVVVIVGGKIGRERMDEEATVGLIALLLSALLYAWNLILQRQQALVARPSEVSTFQNGIVALTLLAGAPFLLVMPDQAAWMDITAGAALAVGAALFLSWAYARAEAQVLVPIEYTGFLWAAFFGWIAFGERVTPSTVLGAVLIVVGCWIATRRQKAPAKPEQTAI